MVGSKYYIDYNDITNISPIDVSGDEWATKFRVTYDDDGEERTLVLDNNCHPCDASRNPESVRAFYNTLMKLWKRFTDQNVLDTLDVPRGSPRPGQFRRRTTDETFDDIFKELDVYDDIYGPKPPSRLPRGGSKIKNKRK